MANYQAAAMGGFILFAFIMAWVFGPQGTEQLGLHSYILVSLAFFNGIGATFLWWLKADQIR